MLRSSWLLIVAVVLIGWGSGEVLTGDPWGVPVIAAAAAYLWWRFTTRRRKR